MNSNDIKIYKQFYIWLTLCLSLVFFIIIVGGLTRLTNSGLSITEWEIFTGIFPPFSYQSWEMYFDQYKKIPQFKLLNQNMNLSLDQLQKVWIQHYFDLILLNGFYPSSQLRIVQCDFSLVLN